MEHGSSTNRRGYLGAAVITAVGIAVGVGLRLLSGSGAVALMAVYPTVIAVALYSGAPLAIVSWVLSLLAGLWACGGSITNPVMTHETAWAFGAFSVSALVSLFIGARARQATLEQQSALAVLEQRVRYDASRAARTKDELLSKISHELRTPLSAIIGWTQVLRAQTPPPTIARGLEVIERNARTQTRIIEELVDANQSGEWRRGGDAERAPVADQPAAAPAEHMDSERSAT